MLHQDIQNLVIGLPRAMREHNLYPEPLIIDGPTTEPTVTINGQSVVQLASGNYLGLATEKTAVSIAVSGLLNYGLTSSGSRHVCGSQDPQIQLERDIAEYQGTEDALLFFLVTIANASIITAILDNPWKSHLADLGVSCPNSSQQIFFDWQSHPSLIGACRQAVEVRRECLRPYRHADMNDLEEKLKASPARIKLIATDGMFSADGDLAPLPEIVELAERYGAMVFVDDAHGVGVLGENGRGIWEHYGLTDRVDFKIGSLAKAFSGGLGGFVACTKELAAYLRVAAGHYIFGGSIPPAIALAISANIKTAQAEPWRRKTVLDNADYLRSKLRPMGFGCLGDHSPIVPIIVGNSEAALSFSAQLLKAGFYAPAFRYPAVPENKGRVRVTMMATHTKEQIDAFVAAFAEIADRNRSLVP